MTDQLKVTSTGSIFVNGSLSDLRVSLNTSNGVRTLVRIDGEKAAKLETVTGIWHKPDDLAAVIRKHLAPA